MEDVREFTADELAALLPQPSRDADKYSRGLLTAIVGSARYPGAACLAAFASQRMGAGYTEVFTDPTAVPIALSAHPSLVVHPRAALKREGLKPTRSGKPRACLVGCGFDSKDSESEQLVHYALKQGKQPVVLDGGGLDAIASKKGRRLVKLRFLQDLATVITPHAHEAERLGHALNVSSADPEELAMRLSFAFGAVTVVKGPVSYIASGDQIVRMSHGSPALAKAGTGDVLAGMIGALLAQGLGAPDACVLATELHARAGLLASARLTDISVTPEDVIEAIPVAIKALIEEAALWLGR